MRVLLAFSVQPPRTFHVATPREAGRTKVVGEATRPNFIDTTGVAVTEIALVAAVSPFSATVTVYFCDGSSPRITHESVFDVHERPPGIAVAVT